MLKTQRLLNLKPLIDTNWPLQLIRTFVRFNDALRQIQPAAAVDLQNNFQDAKPFSEMPGPTGFQMLRNILTIPSVIKEGGQYEIMMKRFEQYGPIFKEKILSLTMVHLCDVSAIEKMYRMEGKYPRRIAVEPWKRWRDQSGELRGVLIEEGTEWKRMRAQLDKLMMRPRKVAEYADRFNEVITDFLTHVTKQKSLPANDGVVPNLDEELFRWSLETICSVLYEVRLGLHKKDSSTHMSEFIQAVQDVFTTTGILMYTPEFMNKTLLRKAHKLHSKSWEIVFKKTQQLIDAKFKELKASHGKTEMSGFLASLMTTEMPMREVYANISELMFGAVDTTSNTMQWALYELTRAPRDFQDQLHTEVTSVCPRGQLPTHSDLQQMPYLKAVIKEALRLYPIANVTSRIPDEDIVLCGYRIPAGTILLGSSYAVARDPANFSDPNSFLPERWLRKSDRDSLHSFAWLPFGFGPRGCIGRRVAELEMHLLLARISQNFVLEPGESEPIKPKIRGLLVPERAVRVRLIDRQ